MKRALLILLLPLAWGASSAASGCDKNRQQPAPAAPPATTDSGATRRQQPPPPGQQAVEQQSAAQQAAQRDATPSANAAVVFTMSDGKELRVPVEVARTAEERRVGLMYRQHLPPDAGMLFLFEADEIHSFWMKNTLIPLDMIFIRADLTVAGTVENAEPRTLTGRTIGKVSRHVLEVNGGWARAHGVVEGTKLRFDQIPEERE